MQSLRARLNTYIDDRSKITAEQAEVIRATGNLAIRACPGSGKTRIVGTRFAYEIVNWDKTRGGIAALSFTNVALEEIADQLEGLGLPRLVSFPHFLGTLNSFVDQFIFLPYGHLVMGGTPISRRPELVLDHNRHWISRRFPLPGSFKNYSICDFHYDSDGSLVWIGSPAQYAPPPANPTTAAGTKARMAHAGFATHTDAMYWALKVLEGYPQIAHAVAARFPEIIVDEFQDTSEVQLAILWRLHKTGLSTLVFIGDPDQSIYEFHHANPGALLSLMSEKGWIPFNLRHNFRSSQSICNVSYKFSSLPQPDQASGDCRDCSIPSMVKVYPDRDIATLPATFQRLISDYGLDHKRSAILTLKNSNVDRLSGAKTPRSFPSTVNWVTRRLIEAAHARDNGRMQEALETTGYCMLDIGFGVSNYGPNRSALGSIPYRYWKQGCYKLLSALPPTNLELAKWLSEAKSVVATLLEEKCWPCCSSLGRRFPQPRSADSNKPTHSFLANGAQLTNIAVKTIHGAKGETHDATMVVASPVLKGQGKSDVLDWFHSLDSNGLRPETVRRAYVAMTRPRRLLVVAVPESAWGKCRQHFIGFKVV